MGEYVAGPAGQGKAKSVLLENGVIEYWTCQFIKRKEKWVHGVWEKREEYKWSIVNKEIHVDYGEADKNDWVVGIISVYRINEDKSITRIASIFKDGKRIDDGTREADLPRYATYKKNQIN